MLAIKPVQTKEEQKQICRLCGVDYLEEYFCYAGYEDGRLLSACQFIIRGNTGYVHGVYLIPDTEDDEALILTGRAVFNFLERCTVKKAVFEDTLPEHERLARMVGFDIMPNGERSVDLVAFFCHKH